MTSHKDNSGTFFNIGEMPYYVMILVRLVGDSIGVVLDDP